LNLALAGSVETKPVEESTHGQGFEPKKAGLLGRYSELGMGSGVQCGLPRHTKLPGLPEAPIGYWNQVWDCVTQSQFP
jgi:hypothetical protein